MTRNAVGTGRYRVDIVRRLPRLKHSLYLVRRRLASVAARTPFLALKESVYDGDYYASFEDVHAPMYVRLVDVLYAQCLPRSVVDVGCGTGQLLTGFRARGATIRGLEGSRAAIARSPVADAVTRWNLERKFPDIGTYDLCLCIEVAEHLPARSASHLVSELTALSDTVVFTAATPGQGGTLHLNEQPHAYWHELFARHGFKPASLGERTRAGIADLREPSWMHENLMVFERSQGRSGRTS